MSIKTNKQETNIQQLQEIKKELERITRKLIILKLDVQDIIENENIIKEIMKNE